MDDASFLAFLWKCSVSIGGAALSFFTVRTFKKLDKIEDDHSRIKEDLAHYKLHVSDNYSKEAITQASLGRIHERIDIGNDANEENFKIIREDIKTILSKVR